MTFIEHCVCGAVSDEPCKRPVGLYCTRDQRRGSAPPEPEPERIETPHDRVADEEIVLYHIMKRDRTTARDRLTPRMEARRLIDALDLARKHRDAHNAR